MFSNTFVIIQKTQEDSFFKHLNAIDDKIQFTKKASRSDSSMPFLDTLVTINVDGSLNTKVYRKPTHTDLYLQWDSHHVIAAKYSVINILKYRAKAVSSNKQLLEEEKDHLPKVLTENKYPIWALNRVKLKTKATQAQDQCKQNKTNAKDSSGNKKSYMVLPYVKGLSESMKNVCKKHGIQTYFRGGNTIKSLLLTPKDKDHISKKSGIIYRFKYNRVDCNDEYIWESSRTFGERYKEHLKAPSPIYDHHNITGHETSIEIFSIVGREDQNLIRAIKEAIYIRVDNPSLNRNIGKYHLPHIWDEVLLNNSELRLK